jgi:putative SOS response-associated peptidase YedK
MCGRYVLHGPHSRLREYFDLRDCAEWQARYNIAPQSDVLVVRQRPELGRVGQLVRWGLIPRWAKDPSIGQKLNNARAETVAEKPSFRTSFERHRCLIPANGFYEWQSVAEGGRTRKQPWYMRPRAEGEFFAMAGLLAAWKSPEGQDIVGTCVITTGPNEVMAPIHGSHAGVAGAGTVRCLARPGLARCRGAQALAAAGVRRHDDGHAGERTRQQRAQRRSGAD